MGEFRLRHHALHLPLARCRSPPPHCQHWRLSAGGQTLEQTLPIREVTPPGWQAHYCAWAPSREPYGFRGKGFAREEQGSTPQGNSCHVAGPLCALLSGKHARRAVFSGRLSLELLSLLCQSSCFIRGEVTLNLSWHHESRSGVLLFSITLHHHPSPRSPFFIELGVLPIHPG